MRWLTLIGRSFLFYFFILILYIVYLTFTGFMSEEPLPKRDICLVPSIETDQTVLGYVNYNLPYTECKNGAPPLIRQKQNKISRILFKYLNTTYLDCCYSDLKRQKDSLEVSGHREYFKKEAQITSEFIKVNCSYEAKVLYEDYFAFPKQCKKVTLLKRYNVLLLGIRAVSRVNAYRQLSKFTNYLRYSLRGIEFSKYNVIDRNVLENIIPAFTGLDYHTFVTVCKTKNAKDSCEWIWNKYSREGYKVLLAEDCADKGIFTSMSQIRNISVDYNLIPFMRIYDEKLGNIPNGECYMCASNRKVYKVLMDYYLNFAKNMRENNQKHFSILWINSLTNTADSRDGLNMLRIAANDLVSFFRSLQFQSFLKDTLVIVFSDSGYMNNELIAIRQFRLEATQPVLFVLPPHEDNHPKPWMRNSLTANADKLVTAYDIHRTMEAIIRLNTDAVRAPEGNRSNRSINLFSKVPHRFCRDLDIKQDLCACKYIARYMSRKPSTNSDTFSRSYLYLSAATVVIFLLYLVVKCCDIVYQ